MAPLTDPHQGLSISLSNKNQRTPTLKIKTLDFFPFAYVIKTFKIFKNYKVKVGFISTMKGKHNIKIN